MDDYINGSQDGWEYGTGRTEPPKSRGGIVAVLLIAVIFLMGIVTVLSILNIRLVRQLGLPEERALAISFTDEQESLPAQTDPQPTEEPGDRYEMELQSFPAIQGENPDGSLTLQEIYRKNIPSVVSVCGTLPGGGLSGSGVVLTRDGLLVTSAQVVEGALEVRVLLTDGREFIARTVGTDPLTDLAVLHIDAQDLTPADFGDSELIQVGDTVAAIGDPLGVELRGTMTDGIICAIHRDVELEGRALSLLQTNAALSAGNAGGPLINRYGQVIGIVTGKAGERLSTAGAEGLGFCVPSATVKTVVDQLISQGHVSGRPTLGITGESLSAFYQNYYRLPAGLYLTDIEAEGPADLAGLQVGDILLKLDGQDIVSPEDLSGILSTLDPGDTVTLTFYRAGQHLTAEVTLQEDK